MQHNNSAQPAPLKLRFLLTSACTARCGYCHNEGQAKDTTQLSLEAINHVLDTLATGNLLVSEVILSGGEPTLHPYLAEIALMLGLGLLCGVVAVIANWAVEARIDRAVLRS